jgi:hypothetical protein
MKALSPPLFVNFTSLEEAQQAFPDQLDLGIWKQLTDKNLPPVISIRFLSLIFGVNPNFISSLIRKPQKNYRHFKIKTGKKERSIDSPKIGIKLFQNWIGHHLSRSIFLEKNVCGFIPGKNGILTAASQHTNATWIYSVDLRDFFHSVRKDLIIEALIQVGYPEESAKLITYICCLREVLPQGSPASPVLSNLAFRNTDSKLIELSLNLNIRYTRYADDLVFSGIGEKPEGLEDKIKSILEADGWVIAPEKEEFSISPYRLKVHGLIVNGASPRLTKGYRNRIRAYKHLLKNNKIIKNKDKINGHLAYSDQVDNFSLELISGDTN